MDTFISCRILQIRPTDLRMFPVDVLLMLKNTKEKPSKANVNTTKQRTVIKKTNFTANYNRALAAH